MRKALIAFSLLIALLAIAPNSFASETTAFAPEGARHPAATTGTHPSAICLRVEYPIPPLPGPGEMCTVASAPSIVVPAATNTPLPAPFDPRAADFAGWLKVQRPVPMDNLCCRQCHASGYDCCTFGGACACC